MKSKLIFKKYFITFIITISTFYFLFLFFLFNNFIKSENIKQFDKVSERNFLLLQNEFQNILLPFEILKIMNPNFFQEKKYTDILDAYINNESPLISIMWAPKISHKDFINTHNFKQNNIIEKKEWHYPVEYISPTYLNNEYSEYEVSIEREIEQLMPKISSEISPTLLKEIPENFTEYNKDSLFVLMPIFSSKYAVPRIDRLDGVLLGVIDLNILINILDLSWDDTKIYFYDSSGKLIFSSSTSIYEISDQILKYENYLNIGGENLRILFTSSQLFPGKNIKILYISFVILNFLLLIITSSAIYIRYLNPNKRLLELVDLKTQELSSNYKKLKLAIEESQVGTIDFDISNDKIYLNRKARFFFQINRNNKIGMNDFFNFIHHDDLKDFKNKLEQIYSGAISSFQEELRICPQDRNERWVFFRGEVYEKSSVDTPKKLLFTVLDISDSKNLQKNVVTDPLTKIYNKRYLNNLLANRLFFSNDIMEIFTLAIFDIDHFKQINDTYGHHAGDFILREFTQFIKIHIRPDDIIARYGGEEFVVVFKDVNRYEAFIIADRIKHEIQSKIFSYDSNDIKMTFSCGLADLSEIKFNSSYNEILKIADSRLYKAKNSGRNLIIKD